MIVQYRQKKYILCRFCNKHYLENSFRNHLYSCHNYINFIKKNYTHRLKWKKEKFVNNVGFYEKLLNNKRVIIVGPSITTQGSNLGKFIEKFDIIVRLNKSLPVSTKLYVDIGKRTDILYNSLNTTDFPGENNINPRFLKSQKIKYLRCPYPPISPFRSDILSFHRKNKKTVNFGHIDTGYYNKIVNKLNTRPYTGTCAICDLLKYNIKELFIMGLDFYTYKHTPSYRNISTYKLQKLQNNRIHQRNPQINLIKRFYLLDNRITTDNVLTDILLEKYDYFCDKILSEFNISDIFTRNGDKSDIKINKNIKIVKNRERNIIIDYGDSQLYVYRDTRLYYNKNVLITETYKNVDNNYNYIKPAFARFLRILLERFIFTRGSLCFELFIVLIFSLYSKSTVIKNIDIYADWHDTDYHNKHNRIEQRLLFKYLLKKDIIKNDIK